MKKIIVASLLLLLPLQSALAFCTWGFPPQGKEFQPLNATEVFISFDDEVQTLVLKPEWQGNAKEFGIVYPTPAKPEVTEGPANLFWQLEEATNPWVNLPQAVGVNELAASAKAEDTVVVVEEKQVAEYDVTVLRATNAKDLVAWLGDNDYNYSEGDEEKVEYYVTQGGFYFVALKVNASRFDVFPRPIPIDVAPFVKGEPIQDIAASSKIIAPDWFWGELSPIQISFATKQPQLPMRTLKSQMPEMVFDLYTLADKALYIPGVDTIWSNVVDAEFLKKVTDLNDYQPKAKWLVRQEVKFDPSKSDEDVYLQKATTEGFTTVTAGTQVRFNPNALNSKTGIIPGVRGQVIHTDGSGTAFTFSRNLSTGSVGEDVKELQRILNAEGFTVSVAGPGSAGNESNYFGLKTRAALIKYQTFYRNDILTPLGLSTGTGYFGQSTIAFINR